MARYQQHGVLQNEISNCSIQRKVNYVNYMTSAIENDGYPNRSCSFGLKQTTPYSIHFFISNDANGSFFHAKL